MTTYMITDSQGQAITAGLQSDEAHRVAQQIADERGASVWLSPETEGEAIEIEPRAETA
ncbi:hypothetical protein [Rhodoplanes serenus]|uniref:hypothetical protein n=1 Tax=Rhodoplanes serenus TaxID=200615 RepID=UPI00131B6AE8|nr:hypothetical protein [Rhodoplanes serenus]